MSFNYEKIKSEAEGDSKWAAFSDLFSMLSVVFLLLYVTASLRSGTAGVQNAQDYKRAMAEVEDLKQQIKAYDTLKQNYLQTGASAQEQEMYQQLMDKLVLLKEEAKDEKDSLRQQARENEQKEQALNQYQQMIRNIINSNMLNSARVKRRDLVIDEKDQDITQKKQTISQLETDVQDKERAIQEGQAQIDKMNTELDRKIKALRAAHKNQKISKEKLNKQIADLRAANDAKVAQLQQTTEQLSEELDQTQSQLGQAQNTIAAKDSALAEKDSKISAIVAEKNRIAGQISEMQGEFDAKMAAERAAFDKKLGAQKMSAAAREAALAKFQADANAKHKAMGDQIAQLEGKFAGAQGQLDKALLAKGQAEAQVGQLKETQAKLSKDLKAAQDLANAKKNLINQIKNNLAKSGVSATVDEGTGDVILKFGGEYFDTGQAALKPGMKDILKKFVPAYSQSLFADPKTAEKIRSVEIIGYASPTYKGKFVNPVSLKAEDRQAVNYNLDLSYYRARSIFDHIFDTDKMKYKHQRDLLPRVKVTGRSFLAGEVDRELASQGMTQAEYCRRYDCKKEQRVIIRFDMGN